jgi:hypothetical protein
MIIKLKICFQCYINTRIMASKDLIENSARLMTEYTYASIEDFRHRSPERFNKEFYEHYSNLIADKNSRKTKLSPVFTMQSCFKIAFSMFFNKFIENLQAININSGDSTLDIIREFEGLDECYGKFIFEVGCKPPPITENKCLTGAFDAKKYFDAKIEATLEKHRNNRNVLALVSQTFDVFLKNVAIWMRNAAWYGSMLNKQGFSASYLMITFVSMGLDYNLVDSLYDEIKAVLAEISDANSKKRLEKKAKAPTEAPKTTTEAPKTTTEPPKADTEPPKADTEPPKVTNNTLEVAGVSSAANISNMEENINAYIGNMLTSN